MLFSYCVDCHCLSPRREVERRRGVLERLREEEGRAAVVMEAQRLEREVRERAGQLQEAQLES